VLNIKNILRNKIRKLERIKTKILINTFSASKNTREAIKMKIFQTHKMVSSKKDSNTILESYKKVFFTLFGILKSNTQQDILNFENFSTNKMWTVDHTACEDTLPAVCIQCQKE